MDNVVYAYRRKGLDYFCTCDYERYLELKEKDHLYDVTKFYKGAGLTSTEDSIDCTNSTTPIGENSTINTSKTFSLVEQMRWAARNLTYNEGQKEAIAKHYLNEGAAFIERMSKGNV